VTYVQRKLGRQVDVREGRLRGFTTLLSIELKIICLTARVMKGGRRGVFVREIRMCTPAAAASLSPPGICGRGWWRGAVGRKRGGGVVFGLKEGRALSYTRVGMPWERGGQAAGDSESCMRSDRSMGGVDSPRR
jgi:hypothetical protein